MFHLLVNNYCSFSHVKLKKCKKKKCSSIQKNNEGASFQGLTKRGMCQLQRWRRVSPFGQCRHSLSCLELAIISIYHEYSHLYTSFMNLLEQHIVFIIIQPIIEFFLGWVGDCRLTTHPRYQMMLQNPVGATKCSFTSRALLSFRITLLPIVSSLRAACVAGFERLTHWVQTEEL